MTVYVRCRPIDSWNGARTDARDRRKASFGVHWDRSLKDLEREIDYLGGEEVVLGLEVPVNKIRLSDGWPKSDANPPPPVVVTFESTHGPLRYQCDRWTDWKSNLRAIVLVMQRQRLVNEAGVGQADQIYRGFQAIGAESMAMTAMTKSTAAGVLIAFGGPMAAGYEETDLGDRALAEIVYKLAAAIHHPDHGGDEDTMRKINVARDVLLR